MLIRPKLFLAFGVVALLSFAASIVALSINEDVENDVKQISHTSVKRLLILGQMEDALMNLQLAFLSIEQGHRILAADGSPAALKIHSSLNEFERSLAACHAAAADGMTLAKADGRAHEVEHAKRAIEAVDSIQREFSELKERLGRAAARNRLAAGTLAAPVSFVAEALDKLIAEVGSFRVLGFDQSQDEIDDVQNLLSEAHAIILWSSVAVLLTGVVLAWFLSRSVLRPIRALTAAAHRIGKGQLDTRVEIASRGEFGLLADTFNRMAGDLRTTTVSKSYVDAIIASMASSLIVIAPDHTIRFINAATSALLGYEEGELIGQPIERILDRARSGPDDLLDRVEAEGRISHIELLYRTASGDSVPVSFSAAVLHEEGENRGIVCVAQDISQQREAEAELRRLNRQLLDATRQAGMAEVATSVLHNVGNVLNSVNVTAETVTSKVRNFKVGNLKNVAALLRENATDLAAFFNEDPRGKELPEYLVDLAENLAAPQTAIIDEMDSLRKNVDHIKEIVSMQQSYARRTSLMEAYSLVDLVEDAIRINSAAFTRHHVQLIREFDESPEVVTDRHQVLHILVNLLGNAKYALAEAQDKRLMVRVTANGDSIARVAVMDNGVGISPENLSRIFQHGFTTKKDGHGFGLHSGSIAARELGGSLTVHSDGPGQGATFTLELPTQLPRTR